MRVLLTAISVALLFERPVLCQGQQYECYDSCDGGTAVSFKCGTFLFLCPDYVNFCEIDSSKLTVVLLSQEQCVEFQSVMIDQECNITGLEDENEKYSTRELSHRTCVYSGSAACGTKIEANDGFDSGYACKDCDDQNLCTTFSESPTDVPSLSPSVSSWPSDSPSVSPEPTASPSESPSSVPTASPSESPSVSPEPSASPTESPSSVPSASPSESPSVSSWPSASPTESPPHADTSSPVDLPTDQCSCTESKSNAYSFKCGQYIFYCEAFIDDEAICLNQLLGSNQILALDEIQCRQMQALEIDDDCLSVYPNDENEVEDLGEVRGLSNFVCYGNTAIKQDAEGCEECKGVCSMECKCTERKKCLCEELCSSISVRRGLRGHGE